MTSQHPAMTRILEVIERLQERPFRTNFVLLGEPGTGKEGLARALHQLTAPGGPLVHVDAAGLSDAETVQVLCGSGREPGAAAAANGGTLLVEEITAFGPRAQLALLRLLKTGRCDAEATRSAANADKRLQVNVIAISDRDLEADVRSGAFRHDLFYRLARILLWLPPLRERLDDVAPAAIWMGNRILRAAGSRRELRLAEDLRRATEQERGSAIELDPNAIVELQQYPWPGNLRELEAAVERALLVFQDGSRLTAAHMRAAIQGGTRALD